MNLPSRALPEPLGHQEAAERAEKLAADHRLGARQQDALASMLHFVRWPQAHPATGTAMWSQEGTWLATERMLATLERKGLVVATGNTVSHWGRSHTEYVVAGPRQNRDES